MKKTTATLMVLLISITLVNLPADIFNTVSADPGEDYPYQPDNDIIVDALGYLKSQQTEDGSIGGFSISAWAAMAISAAGEDPHDWGNLVGYLRDNADCIDDTKATDWERQVLAIVACNENPRDFGGIDYLAKVESFYDSVQIGSPANLYDDFFGILALVSGGVEKDSSVIQTVRTYIEEKQHQNGGWGDIDSTAAAIMALITAGENPNSGSIADALSFMKSTQTENGGFQSWGTTNAASTAWSVNAIVAAGQDPTSIEWKHSSSSPIDFLLSLQQENGAFNWSVNQNMNPEWMTSYVIPALLGKPYPVKIYESEKGGDEDDNGGNENNGDNDGGDDDSGDNNVDEDEWTGNIRVEGQTDTIWNSMVCFSDSVITALNDSSGEMEDYYIPYPSVLGALDEASQQGGFPYFVIYYPSWDAFYVKTIAGESDWWHYWVDYTLPMVDAGAYGLTEEDEEVLWGYLEDWTAHALRITVNKDTVNVSEELIVRVYNETMSPVEDAIVYVDSSEYMTNENGNVTIHIDTAGEYEIFSEKDGYVRSEKVTVHVKKSVVIIKPEDNAIYILNRKTGIQYPSILIIGHIDIEVKTTDDVEKVEFYINGKFEYVDTERPFKWRSNNRAFFKKTTIKVKAYASLDDVIFKIQQIIKYIDSLSEDHPVKHVFDTLKTYLQNLEVSVLNQSGVDEKEVRIINIFPRLHIL
ncbi:MAG: hypothetical protein JSW60_06450 [Thermoplasmatales archaeon]|nr:MAG: hypothetical protein JSW60_06450 [Thermoplasmatales archaeon]